MQATLIDKMGTDLTIVNAARVSFHKESKWENYEGPYDKRLPRLFKETNLQMLTLSEKDQKLIKYLAKHDHWTPFSHVMITMREKVPIFVARQRFKHMVGFTYNEVSRRYVDDAPEFFIPNEWRGKPKNAKQGSSDEIITRIGFDHEQDSPIDERYKFFLKSAKALYEDMVGSGVAPEQARMVLPQSMYTEYYVTGSLAAWARAYKLRIDAHAQKEIQDLAKEWGNIITDIGELKYSWEALTNG